MKINYHKSEVLVFGVDKEEQDRVANMLNCKVGKLPLNYLGLPISDRKLGVKTFDKVQLKMRNKLQPCKGKNLSSGGRLILTNSSLSSIPLYLMGMFALFEGNHQHMDSIRSKFFWRGDIEKFKYHMIKWARVCLPKDYGGLGALNTKRMNEGLLLKWAWRMYKDDGRDKVCEFLCNKYLKKNFTSCKGSSGSQFWQGIDKIKNKLKWGRSLKWVMVTRSCFGKMCGFKTNLCIKYSLGHMLAAETRASWWGIAGWMGNGI